MATASSTISISDDSSESQSSAQGTSDTVSNHGTNDFSSQSISKPRNIAVKKGKPVDQPQPHRPKEKGLKWDKNLLEGTGFLKGFNPQTSRREKNKRYNVSKQPTKPAKKKSTSMYDEQGRIRMTAEDVCDCFDLNCPGCHFPCMSCTSPKCGIHCRVNRKFAYDLIELDGKNQPLTNPLLTTVRN